MSSCRDCGAAMLREDQFCPQCGKSMNTSSTCCESCGYPAPVGARFCIKCGARVGSAPVVPDTGSAALRQTEPSAQVIALKPVIPVPVLTSNTIQSELARSPEKDPGTPPHRVGAAPSRLPIAVVVVGFALAIGVYLSLTASEEKRASATASPVSGTRSTPAATGTLGTTKLDAGEFSIRHAFTALYGNYDPNLDGAFWTAGRAPAELEQWNGKSLFIRPLISRAFREGGRPRQIVVTNSLEVKNGDVVKQGTGCRTCGSLIGAVVFENEGDEWKLISRHDFLTAAGSWGAPPKVSLTFQRAGAIELQFETRARDQREPEKRRYTIVLKERKAPPDVRPASANNDAQSGRFGQQD
jgi:hypothetical protein